MWRMVAPSVGLVFFALVAAANGIMALGLGPAHPLMVLWVLVPVPLLFLLLRFRAPRAKALRIVGYTYLGVAAFLTVILWAIGWYFADVLRDGALVPDHTPSKYDLRVGAIDEGRVTLLTTADTEADGSWTRGGTWGLEWEGGYGQVEGILDISSNQVTREYVPVNGSLREGDLVRLDSWTFPGDPLQDFGIPFREVSYSSPLGDFTAWLIDGSDSTWVIFVHGKGAEEGQAMRMVPTIAETRHPFMVITYRNDKGVPPSTDGYYRYGQTEWKDLEGAVQYALNSGAEDVALVGYSMGGAIIAAFLYESPLADEVSRVVLDAPMMNFNATVDLGATQKGYPGIISTIGKAVSSFRFNVDWSALDYLGRTDEIHVPILLFHGDADNTVPIETSDALAKARPDLVTYIEVNGAPHVCSWNIDPERYDKAVADFLRGISR